MKALWEKYAARIDALSMRERMFLFLSVLVCCLAIADTLWLTPAQQAQRALVQRFGAQTTELNRLRTELQTTGRPSDEALATRKEMESLQARLDEVNREIQASAPSDAAGPALEKVLMEFLRRQDGLTLLGTGTLKSDSLATGGTSATGANAPAGLTRQGLELRVAGPYPELVRYVKALETALPKLRWGPMQLKADKAVPELTLQVYLVGAQP